MNDLNEDVVIPPVLNIFILQQMVIIHVYLLANILVERNVVLKLYHLIFFFFCKFENNRREKGVMLIVIYYRK